MGRTSFDMTSLTSKEPFLRAFGWGSLAFGILRYVQASASSIKLPCYSCLGVSVNRINLQLLALSWGPSASCLKPNFLGSCLNNIKSLSNFPRISGSGHTQANFEKTGFHRTSGPERILLSNNFPQSDFCYLWMEDPLPSLRNLSLIPSASLCSLLLRPHLQTFRKKRLGGVLKPRIKSVISKCIRNTEVFFNVFLKGVLVFITF